jgi:hypothetical protein
LNINTSGKYQVFIKKYIQMKKDTKTLLFERMEKIAGVKLKEDVMTIDDIKKAAQHHDMDGDEASMYQPELDKISEIAADLHEKLKAFDELPSWVQDKITIASHNMEAIHGWIESLAHEQKHDDMVADEVDDEPDFDEDNFEDDMDESYIREAHAITEKNEPNDKALWSRAKSAAKKKFDVYPSAYANAWAAKWYKKKGGTWRKGKK